jgi:polyhydroxybutyrate depolymerase
MGFSNGGHLAYRLAIEHTDEISAVAVVAANFSAEESCDCRHTGKPMPVVIMNGTADTLNPYNGGIANWGVRVRSAVETAEYFAKLNGLSGPPQTTHHAATDEISVDRALWSEPGKPEVELITIVGGAHAIPMYANLDAPSEVWRFISRQHPSY